MPTPTDTIQPFVDRLLRDPGVLMTDEAFVRSFNLLGLPLRRAIMDRVESVRRQTAATERLARGYGASEERVARIVAETPLLRRGTSNNDINIDAFHSDEENARLDRVAQMRRDMAREIEEFRFQATTNYQQRRPEQRTTERFQMWSEWVERTVAAIRARGERRIAAATPPSRSQSHERPLVYQWPDPADYGPNNRYRSVRGALSAFTRAFNSLPPNLLAGNYHRREAGHGHIRRMWAGVSETARRANLAAVPPPPTTTPWTDEPEVDELDIMIKHLPRSGKCVVLVDSSLAAMTMRRKLDAANIPDEHSYVFRITHVARDSALNHAIKSLGRPIFIDPAVFKMHAKREGDWTDEELDAIIQLQGEIPDAEAT